MTGLVIGTGAKLAESALISRATSIPKPVWEALAVIGYVLALIALHQHIAHDAIATAKAEQKAVDQKALDQTVANYRAAAAKAKAEDDAKNAATQARQAQINQETAGEYQTRLATNRADIQRLQQELAARRANSGGSTGTSVPDIPTPTCGADAPTLDPVTRAFDCAIQLDELITNVERQHAVDPNAGASK